jgi:hypothetical protein
MPAPLAIAALAAAARAARVIQSATRTTGGIKTAKTVQKVYKEGSAAPARTQAQINADGIAKAKEALRMPREGTPAAKNAAESRKRLAESHLNKSRITGN